MPVGTSNYYTVRAGSKQEQLSYVDNGSNKYNAMYVKNFKIESLLFKDQYLVYKNITDVDYQYVLLDKEYPFGTALEIINAEVAFPITPTIVNNRLVFTSNDAINDFQFYFTGGMAYRFGAIPNKVYTILSSETLTFEYDIIQFIPEYVDLYLNAVHQARLFTDDVKSNEVLYPTFIKSDNIHSLSIVDQDNKQMSVGFLVEICYIVTPANFRLSRFSYSKDRRIPIEGFSEAGIKKIVINDDQIIPKFDNTLSVIKYGAFTVTGDYYLDSNWQLTLVDDYVKVLTFILVGGDYDYTTNTVTNYTIIPLTTSGVLPYPPKKTIKNYLTSIQDDPTLGTLAFTVTDPVSYEIVEFTPGTMDLNILVNISSQTSLSASIDTSNVLTMSHTLNFILKGSKSIGNFLNGIANYSHTNEDLTTDTFSNIDDNYTTTISDVTRTVPSYYIYQANKLKALINDKTQYQLMTWHKPEDNYILGKVTAYNSEGNRLYEVEDYSVEIVLRR